MTSPRVNPIIKKDLKVISRSMKYSWGLFAYEAVLALIFLIALSMINTINSYGYVAQNTEIYTAYVAFFPVLAISELCIIAIIIPIITASSISGERERKTMDVLLTTTISSRSIILGKITSAVIRVMMFVIASIPLLSVSFIVGGMSWLSLFEFLILACFFAFFAGSIGIFCSSICKKSITSIILSYVIYFGIYGVSFVPMIFAAVYDSDEALFFTFLLQAGNPVMSFVAFFMKVITGESLASTFYYSNYSLFTSKFGQILFSTGGWLTLSIIVQAAIAALFIWGAAMRIKPGKK